MKTKRFVVPEGTYRIAVNMICCICDRYGDFEYGEFEIKEIEIPKDVTEILLPGSVEAIDDNAFDGCSSLTEINIPNSVTKIDEKAFDHCSSLTSIRIPVSVEKVCEGAFGGCSSLKTVHVPRHLYLFETGIPKSAEIIRYDA